MQRRELDQALWRDLEALVRDEAAGGARARPAPLRGRRSAASARARAAARARARRRAHALREDRPDRRRPVSARGIVQDYKSGKSAHSAREIEKELRLQIPLYMLVLRDLVGLEPLGGVYRPLAGERKARGLLRAATRRRPPGLRQERLPRRGGVLGAGRGRSRDGPHARAAASAPATSARPEGRRVPGVVRPLDDVPGGARVTVR